MHVFFISLAFCLVHPLHPQHRQTESRRVARKVQGTHDRVYSSATCVHVDGDTRAQKYIKLSLCLWFAGHDRFKAKASRRTLQKNSLTWQNSDSYLQSVLVQQTQWADLSQLLCYKVQKETSVLVSVSCGCQKLNSIFLKVCQLLFFSLSNIKRKKNQMILGVLRVLSVNQVVDISPNKRTIYWNTLWVTLSRDGKRG